jgi:hypothetical protein
LRARGLIDRYIPVFRCARQALVAVRRNKMATNGKPCFLGHPVDSDFWLKPKPRPSQETRIPQQSGAAQDNRSEDARGPNLRAEAAA